jgi:hypothetical protein
MRNLALGAVMLTVVAVGAIACGSSFTGTEAPSGADASTVEAGGVTDAGPGTDAMGNGVDAGVFKDAGPGGGTKPGMDAGVLDGVFVSAVSGHDSANGTMAAPLQTLGAAIGLAQKLKKTVIACSGTYNEALVVKDGVSVYGDFDCTTNPAKWTETATNAKLISPTSPALRADNIVTGTTIGNIDITAPDAAGTEPSSIGAIINASPGLELSHLLITTGKAQDGTAGTDGAQLVDDATVLPIGQPGGTNTCGGSPTYFGGAGGAGGSRNQKCNAGMPPTITTVSFAPGAGAPGYAGGGAPGASSSGGSYVSAQGFIRGDGAAGASGNGGTGKTGGPATNTCAVTADINGFKTCDCTNGGISKGTGGVAGGCPGVAGSPGTGGGASIGVISFGAAVTLTTVSITTGKGGDGGKGTGGSSPTVGGDTAAMTTMGTQPGVSGSGAGGPSVSVIYQIAPPIFSKGAKGIVTVGVAGKGVPSFTSTDGARTVLTSADGKSGDYVPMP